METERAERAPEWAVRLHRLNRHLTEDLWGGPKPFTMAWVINLHKAAQVNPGSG